MAIIKKNIWAVFLLVLAISLGLFLAFSHFLWKNNEAQFFNKQMTQAELFATSVSAFLNSNESLLDALGTQLIETRDVPPSAQYSDLLDRIVRANSSLIGLGLVNADGDPMYTSSNQRIEQLPNLLKNEKTRDSFIEVTKSDRLMTGRTYSHPALNGGLVMPIRQPIRDEKGDLLAVMTGGIDVAKSPMFNEHLGEGSHHEIGLLRDDGFFQFFSGSLINSGDYNIPAEAGLLEQIKHRAFYHDSADGSVRVAKHLHWQSVHLVAVYNERYGFWVVSALTNQHIRQAVTSSIGLTFIVFVVFIVMLYLMVRSIARNERETLARLYHQNTHDLLTGLPNRRYLKDHLDDWLDEQQSSGFALLYVDIERFKGISDTYGHAFGNKVLIEVSKRLSNAGGLVARDAVDWFICLHPNGDECELTELAEGIVESLSRAYIIDGVSIFVHCALGIARAPAHGSDIDELVGAADIAQAHAKYTNSVVSFYNPDMQRKFDRRVQLEQRLRQAILAELPFMVYQPQLRMDGTLYGVEALARWQDDEYGFVPPDHFIKIAEVSGLMPSLGDLIIEKSLRELSLAQAKVPFQLSINISVKQFMSANFVLSLKEQLKRFGVAPSQLTLEITENLFVENMTQVKATCDQLRHLGVRISLDDFGTGYSSLSMLSELPIDEIKIDKTFVDSITQCDKSLTMLNNIIAIGSGLGATVLAEGVETEEQKALLTRSSCELMQGYLFAKPMPYAQLVDYLASHTPTPSSVTS